MTSPDLDKENSKGPHEQAEPQQSDEARTSGNKPVII